MAARKPLHCAPASGRCLPALVAQQWDGRLQLLPTDSFESSSGLLRLEGQRRAVHAVAQAGGGRPVLKHVAKVAQATGAAHLQGRWGRQAGGGRDGGSGLT